MVLRASRRTGSDAPLADDSGRAGTLAFEVRGLITVEQARRFLLNALYVGKPCHVRLWPEGEGRVTMHARRKRVVARVVEGAAGRMRALRG